MSANLDLPTLQQAVRGGAAAFRCRRKLQPAGGPGDKVFPPTFAGAVYAVEQRRVPGHSEPVPCVVLDTVQSQANNMEAALQAALDAGKITIPVIQVDFKNHSPNEDDDDEGRLKEQVGNGGIITSLQVPHRLADAILRDSEFEEKDGKKRPFRSSTIGKALNTASQMDALSVYRYCPTALLFGMWDSTGPKGGLGAKFERAFVSEVVGVNASFGIKTASRIDPLIAATKGIVLYQHQDPEKVWTLDEGRAAKDKSGKSIKLGKKDPGKVSNANLGNVTPGFAKYSKGAEGPDPMQARNAFMRYTISESGKEASVESRVELARGEAKERGIAPGGVTIDYAEQLTTISLIALRRLRFPVAESGKHGDANIAAQVVLTALGLCAATLAFENGMGLRSRCLLWPEEAMIWELLQTPGSTPSKFTLSVENAISLLQDSIVAAKEVGVTWEDTPVRLTPNPDLVKLVRLSQIEASSTFDETGE